jgi:hypothetical protein
MGLLERHWFVVHLHAICQAGTGGTKVGIPGEGIASCDNRCAAANADAVLKARASGTTWQDLDCFQSALIHLHVAILAWERGQCLSK